MPRMRALWLVGVLGALGCNDKAKADYDRCVERDNAYDVPGAYSACVAATAADPNSPSGQAAAKKLETLQPIFSKLNAERGEKAARDDAIKKADPALVPQRLATAVVSAQPVAPPPDPQALFAAGDLWGARAILEQRLINADKPQQSDVALLTKICKVQKDKFCLATIKKASATGASRGP